MMMKQLDKSVSCTTTTRYEPAPWTSLPLSSPIWNDHKKCQEWTVLPHWRLLPNRCKSPTDRPFHPLSSSSTDTLRVESRKFKHKPTIPRNKSCCWVHPMVSCLSWVEMCRWKWVSPGIIASIPYRSIRTNRSFTCSVRHHQWTIPSYYCMIWFGNKSFIRSPSNPIRPFIPYVTLNRTCWFTFRNKICNRTSTVIWPTMSSTWMPCHHHHRQHRRQHWVQRWVQQHWVPKWISSSFNPSHWCIQWPCTHHCHLKSHPLRYIPCMTMSYLWAIRMVMCWSITFITCTIRVTIQLQQTSTVSWYNHRIWKWRVWIGILQIFWLLDMTMERLSFMKSITKH